MRQVRHSGVHRDASASLKERLVRPDEGEILFFEDVLQAGEQFSFSQNMR